MPNCAHFMHIYAYSTARYGQSKQQCQFLNFYEEHVNDVITS